MARIASFLKRRIDILILFFIWLYSSALHFLWLTMDKKPPWGDGISFILRGLHLTHIQKIYGWGELAKSFFNFDVIYPSPPIIESTYFLYYKIFGLFSDMEMVISSLYLAIGIIGVYGVARHLFDRYAGLLSALIFTSVPGVIYYSKLGFKEFHIMCLLAPALYLLLKADNFRNRRFSILFAIPLAITILIKLEGAIFLILPIFFSIAKGFSREVFLKDRSRVTNFVLFFVISILISSFWYVINFENFMQLLLDRTGNTAGINSIYFSTKNAGLYAYQLYNEIFSKAQVVIFIAILMYIIIRALLPGVKTLELRRLTLLSLCFVFPLAVFSFLCAKDASHLLPLIVFASLIIAGGCSVFRSKTVKYILILVVVFNSLNTLSLQLFAHGSATDPPTLFARLSPADYILYNLRENLRYPYGKELKIEKRVWRPKLTEIIKFISQDYKSIKSNGKPTVLLMSNYEPLRFFQLQYYNEKLGLPVSLLFYCWEMDAFEHSLLGSEYDYIVLQKPLCFHHPNHPEANMLKKLYFFIEKNQGKFNLRYKIVKEIELPRQLKVVIYKRSNLESAQ